MRAKTLGQKAEASLRLLLGMRLPEVVRALTPHGFDGGVIRQGFTLLEGLATARGPVPEPEEPRARLGDLEEFRGWVPIARRVLGRAHPQTAETLLGGLRRVDGPVTLPMLGVFLSRWDALARGDAEYGPDHRQAAALLAQRGMGDAERERLRERIESFTCVEPKLNPGAELARESAALTALWDWYLEWSTIARRARLSRNARLALGF
ncbi:MAG TPA: hypothetical protein VLC09_10170 [Polyangiaceae bacterium]|nr:hypothetical protein [Polyangiaceae bacterium]